MGHSSQDKSHHLWDRNRCLQGDILLGMLLSPRKELAAPSALSPVRGSWEEEGRCWLGGTEVASCHGELSSAN